MRKVATTEMAVQAARILRKISMTSPRLEPSPFRLNRNGGSLSCFDAFSSREPVSTPDHVRGRLSLENALGSAHYRKLVICVRPVFARESAQVEALKGGTGAEQEDRRIQDLSRRSN